VPKKYLASERESFPLTGRGILVTRPREQAAGLARLIEQAGGRAHLFPAIEIQDLPPPQALARLAEFDLAVFVSPTAVAKALPQVGAWPRALRVAAVGAGTRRELEKHGIAQVITPRSGADSEALLATPELADVAGRRIAILRGDGGRALLGDTFVARGAQVEYISCYRRLAPKPPPRPWRAGELAAVTVSSSQGLDNLFAVLDPAMLRATPLFVPHPRIAERARALAAREVVRAGHSDAEMLDALVAYFRSHE
jgi:uroporphyrinogen-III synthase